MVSVLQRLNCIVAALCIVFLVALGQPGAAESHVSKLDSLFDRLKTVSADEAGEVEAEIWIEWTKSGSAAIDLLLNRGRTALAEGDLDAAIGHFSAVIDHAPNFPEGWNQRAIAYYERGDMGLVVDDIAQTLNLEPRHFGALMGLAAVFEDMNRPESAIKVYDMVLTIHPHAPGVTEAQKRLKAETQGTDL